MSKFRYPAILAGLAVLVVSGPSLADVSAGISIDEDGLQGFYLAVGEHYSVPAKEVVLVHEQKFPDEELPVIYFIARRVDVSPEVVIKLRLGGQSWMEVSAHFGLSGDAYHIPLKSDPGPPYGKAYGHFKNKKSGKHKEVALSDGDVVNLVNLRFISEYYDYAPEDVITLRSEGKSFVEINRRVKDARKQKPQSSKQVASKDNAADGGGGKSKSAKSKK